MTAAKDINVTESWHVGSDGLERLEVRCVVPVVTRSELNTRGHWSKKALRARTARGTTMLVVRSATVGRFGLGKGIVCRLTRVAPGVLDGDNLQGALKWARDGVADAFGIDDRDGRIAWEYDQRRGKRGKYAVEVWLRRNA